MIRIAVEVRGDEDFSRIVVHAASISEAVEIARDASPAREVRVVFPIEAEAFFEAGRAANENEGDAGDLAGDGARAGELHHEAVVYEGLRAGRRDA